MAIELDINLVNLVVAVAIPLLVGLVTKAAASATVKAITNFTLSAIAAALQVILDACSAVCTIELKPFLATFFVTWVTSIATHYGLWKPTGTASAVQEKTAHVGIS